MVTRFEKRAIAWVLTVMMCLSMVLSSGTVAYAEDNGLAETDDAVTAESRGGEDAESIEIAVPADADEMDSVEKDTEMQEVKAVETEESEKTKEGREAETFGEYEYQVLESGTVNQEV